MINKNKLKSVKRIQTTLKIISIVIIFILGLIIFNQHQSSLVIVKSKFSEVNIPKEEINSVKNKLNTEISPLEFLLNSSTYLGGTGMEYGNSLSVDSQDNVLVMGHTDSNNFPMINAYQGTSGGNYDVFLAKFFSEIFAIMTRSAKFMMYF